jgi:hypothetical protein
MELSKPPGGDWPRASISAYTQMAVTVMGGPEFRI